VHLTPKARAFFSLAISEQNVAFAKSSLAFGAGDSHVRRDGLVERNQNKRRK
jgi:hypothetical protein